MVMVLGFFEPGLWQIVTLPLQDVEVGTGINMDVIVAVGNAVGVAVIVGVTVVVGVTVAVGVSVAVGVAVVVGDGVAEAIGTAVKVRERVNVMTGEDVAVTAGTGTHPRTTPKTTKTVPAIMVALPNSASNTRAQLRGTPQVLGDIAAPPACSMGRCFFIRFFTVA